MGQLFPNAFGESTPNAAVSLVCCAVSTTILIAQVSSGFANIIQIKCCLQEWESGQHINVPFTVEAFSHDNDQILETIAQVETHNYHSPSYRNAKKAWAIFGVCVANFIHFYIFVLFIRRLIPVHVLSDQAEHGLSTIILRRY